MMKKTLLIGGLLVSAMFANAQQRLALYEEFSGENCGPCAALNPALWTLISTPGNDAKVLLLKYQSPIPSSGPIYEENTVFTDNRMDYYSINFAPHGSLNGAAVGTGSNAGNISLTTQAMINTASAGIPAFTMSISNPTYNADGQSFTATVTVTATAAANFANLKLRFVLAEELDYATAPGTNGETQFHNVVRQMYPSADGQAVQASWTNGQSMTYTITGGIPSYVKTSSVHKFFAAFLQTEGDKVVLQAAKTGDITINLPAVDIATTSVTGVSGLNCSLPTSLTPSVTVKNTGTTPLTKATFYTRVGSGAYGPAQVKTFSPAIAAGQTQVVALSPVSVTTAGAQNIVDSVAMPNDKTDWNTYDNIAGSTAYVLNSTAAPLPLSNTFETANPDWVSWPGAGTNAYPILRASNGTGTPIGHNSSAYTMYYPCQGLGQGYTGYLIFPKADLPAGAKAIDFYIAYAMRATIGDKLELVYTADCGTTWTSVWSKSNADLANAPATSSTTLFVPSSNADWKLWSVDVSTVPTGANFAFKATSGGGNYIFIDDVNVRTGSVTGINELVAEGSLNVYPNPTTGTLNVKLDLKKSAVVGFTIYNMLGQQIQAPVTTNLNAGSNVTSLNTNDLAAGMYYLNITTEAGSVQQKFTKQ